MTPPPVSPRVSVVVPTYQRAHYLEGVIGMLLAQTLDDIEVIVADDGSTDGTSEVVGRVRDSRLRYLRPGRLGMPGILNEGFRAARGAYVMTCHDHDVYEPTLLEALAGALDRHPTAAYAHSGLLLVDPSGRRVIQRHVHAFAPLTPGRAFLRDHLLWGLDSAVSALTMVRRDALGGDLFDPSYGFVADVEMWLRLASRADVAYVASPLIRVRQRDETSELFAIGATLALDVLRAKRAHLHVVEDRARARQIEAHWRRQALSTVLRELFYARHDSGAALDDIERLAREAGSTAALAAIALFRRVPRGISAGALRSMRYTARVWRGLSVADSTRHS